MTTSGSQNSNPVPEVAFYYPNPVWRMGSWIKNLILFSDGIGLLVPNYMKERPEEADPSIATALKDKGLLHILEPETLVDTQATEQLATAMTEVIISGALDDLSKEKTAFHELSYSRLGRVVTFDLETVGVDLSSVPMDEVLGFREEYGEEYRKYARCVRRFVRELSMPPEEEYMREFDERQQELDEIARDLKSRERKAWKIPAWFALTATGAA